MAYVKNRRSNELDKGEGRGPYLSFRLLTHQKETMYIGFDRDRRCM